VHRLLVLLIVTSMSLFAENTANFDSLTFGWEMITPKPSRIEQWEFSTSGDTLSIKLPSIYGGCGGVQQWYSEKNDTLFLFSSSKGRCEAYFSIRLMYLLKF
jgi:hypothetical protein